jgi:CRISPR-associated protein Cas2
VDILVSYDVSTETPAGRRRLRKVADICIGYGQRVQKSVFECSIDPVQYEALRDRLVHAIDPAVDSLRIYHLREPRQRYVRAYGIDQWRDYEEPLVL